MFCFSVFCFSCLCLYIHICIHALLSTEDGIRVLDLGCGTGNYTNALAERFPNSTFIGLDYSTQALSSANDTKKQKGVMNVKFVEGDAHALPKEWIGTFDMVFMNNVLHDLPDPFTCLDEIYKVMKTDGCFCLLEVGCHSDPLKNVCDATAAMNYSLSIFICLASSLVDPPHVGYGAMWGIEEIEKALTNHKFTFSKDISDSMLGPTVAFYCTKG